MASYRSNGRLGGLRSRGILHSFAQGGFEGKCGQFHPAIPCTSSRAVVRTLPLRSRWRRRRRQRGCDRGAPGSAPDVGQRRAHDHCRPSASLRAAGSTIVPASRTARSHWRRARWATLRDSHRCSCGCCRRGARVTVVSHRARGCVAELFQQTSTSAYGRRRRDPQAAPACHRSRSGQNDRMNSIPDSATKQNAASAATRAAAGEHLGAIFDRLEALRLGI
jgi:hypothetical protein